MILEFSRSLYPSRRLHDQQSIERCDAAIAAHVRGGGHLVVGSIKFVEGMRKEVLQRLAEMIGGLEGV